MKTVTYESSGHKFNIAVPESVEEYDSLAKKSGAALQAAIDHEVYHGTLGDIRDGFADAVAEHYKTPRREIGTGVFEGEGEEKKEVTKIEKTEVYLNRIVAEHNLTGEFPFQHIADSLSHGGAKEVKFDPSVRERKAPKPAKLPAWAMEQAKQFLATATDKAKAKFIAKYAEVSNGATLAITGDVEVDIKAFANAAVDIKRAANVFAH